MRGKRPTVCCFVLTEPSFYQSKMDTLYCISEALGIFSKKYRLLAWKASLRILIQIICSAVLIYTKSESNAPRVVVRFTSLNSTLKGELTKYTSKWHKFIRQPPSGFLWYLPLSWKVNHGKQIPGVTKILRQW